jgi:hypothetical protein
VGNLLTRWTWKETNTRKGDLPDKKYQCITGSILTHKSNTYITLDQLRKELWVENQLTYMIPGARRGSGP